MVSDLSLYSCIASVSPSLVEIFASGSKEIGFSVLNIASILH